VAQWAGLVRPKIPKYRKGSRTKLGSAWLDLGQDGCDGPKHKLKPEQGLHREVWFCTPELFWGSTAPTTPWRRFGHERLRQRSEVALIDWGSLGRVVLWRCGEARLLGGATTRDPSVCFPAKAQAFGLYSRVHGARLRARWQRDTFREKGGSHTG
jgi:hypothetical protein